MSQSAFKSPVRSGLYYLYLFYVLFLMVFPPLLMGGKGAFSFYIVESVSLLVLFFYFLKLKHIKNIHKGLVILALGAFFLPLLFLVPVSGDLWSWLPGRSFYASGMIEFFEYDFKSDFRAISFNAYATEMAFYALIPLLGMLLVIDKLNPRQIKLVVFAFISMAFFQSVLGVIQSAQSAPSYGTFSNRNNLAGMLLMSLPMVLFLLAHNLRNISQSRVSSSRFKSGNFIVKFFSSGSLGFTVLLFFVSLFIILGVVFSRSRAGIVLMVVGLLFVVIVFSLVYGKSRSVKFLGVVVSVALTLAIMIGIDPVVSRFGLGTAFEDVRWDIYSKSFEGLGQFFPIGSGVGTFPDVFRRFQPDNVSGFVNHAHNSYIEYIFEGGVLSLVIIASFVLLFFVRFYDLLNNCRDDVFYSIQLGCGVGIALVGLHDTVDFNLYVPANSIYFILLVSILFYKSDRLILDANKSIRVKSKMKLHSLDESLSHPKHVVSDDEHDNPFNRP